MNKTCYNCRYNKRTFQDKPCSDCNLLTLSHWQTIPAILSHINWFALCDFIIGGVLFTLFLIRALHADDSYRAVIYTLIAIMWFAIFFVWGSKKK